MAVSKIETDRLILRKFESGDMEPLYLLLADEDVNTFLPWFPVKNLEEAGNFYRKRIAGQEYCFAVCLKDKPVPIGYVKADMDESHDFGYALRKEFWHRGIAAEASLGLIRQLKKDGVPYITATHDQKNPRSGGVMRRAGMKYRYSYVEQWQPKNLLAVFRMYQLNLDGQDGRTYQAYWNRYPLHFIEKDL